MHDLDAMAVAMQALLEVDERDVERAALVIVDKDRVQKVTPFGGKVDLILDLVLRCGLDRLDRYPCVDAAGLVPVPVPGWELIIDRRPITTIRYPGADRTFASTRLDAPDRWWSASHTHGTVTLMVVGGPGHPLRPRSDATAELDAAAQHGALAAGVITVAQQPDDPTASAAPEPMSWPLYGVTITAENARFTLNVSSPADGLLTAMPLHPHEVRPLATELSRALTDSTAPVNASAIVRAVTGRQMPPPVRR